MTTFVQTVIDAVSLGSLYALTALGVGLIFSIMRLINFAHGSLIMLGGYMLFFLTEQPLILMFLLTVVAVIALAILMERVGFRPVRGADPTTLLTASFALSVLVENLATLSVGALGKSVSFGAFFTESWFVGDFQVRKLSILTLLVTAVLLAGLVVFFRATSAGFQMRAAAENFQMARLLGVRANRVIATAFALSGLLAAAVSILLVAQTGSVTPDMGTFPVIIAFVAAVIGGLGSLPGAVLGGFTFGCLATVLQTWLPDGISPYRDAFTFGIVILVLLVRPQGMLGRQQGGRVV
jgi:branched-chain amino acid transport system permease protein